MEQRRRPPRPPPLPRWWSASLWLWGALAACDDGHGTPPAERGCEPLSLETAVGSPEFGAPPVVGDVALPLPGRGACFARCRVTAQADPELGPALAWTYTFDDAGLPVEADDADWTWNGDELLAAIQEPGEEPTTYTYDRGRLARSVSHTSSYEDVADIEITYTTRRDATGRIAVVDRTVDSTSAYAHGPETESEAFTYEQGGDRPAEILERTDDQLRRHRLTYDGRGRTVSWVRQWGDSDGTSWRRPEEYRARFEGDLLVGIDESYDGNPTAQVAFEYDELGRLLRREVSVPPGGGYPGYPEGLVFERTEYVSDCD